MGKAMRLLVAALGAWFLVSGCSPSQRCLPVEGLTRTGSARYLAFESVEDPQYKEAAKLLWENRFHSITTSNLNYCVIWVWREELARARILLGSSPVVGSAVRSYDQRPLESYLSNEAGPF